MSKTLSIIAVSIAVGLLCALSFVLGWAMAPVPAAPPDAGSSRVMLNGQPLDIPPGYEAVIEAEQDDGTYKVVADSKEWGKTSGSSSTNIGGTVNASIGAGKSKLDLPSGAHAESTGITAKIKANGGLNTTTILGGLGVLAFIAGGVLFWMGWKGIGTGLLVTGAACVVGAFIFETAPWFVYIVAALALAILGYVIYRSWKAKQQANALKVVVQGVENAEPSASAKVKAKVKELAGTLGLKKAVDNEVQAVVKK